MDPVPELDCLVIQLFQRQRPFATWIQLYGEAGCRTQVDPIVHPVYYGSYLEFPRVLPALIDATNWNGSRGHESLGPFTCDCRPNRR